MELRPGYKKTEIGVLPEDWQVGALSTVVERLAAGVSVNSSDEASIFASGGKAVLKTSAIFDGRFDCSERKPIAERDLARARLNPKAGAILISRMNTPQLVGECGYVESDMPDLFIPDRIWMTSYRRDVEFSERWLAYLLSSKPLKNRIQGIATGTSGSMKNIAKDAMLAMLLPFPPVSEQKAIADALSDADAAIGALARLIAKKRDLRQGAMQRLLTGQTRLPGFNAPWQERRLGEFVETDPENLGADTEPFLRFNYIALENVDRGRLRGWSNQEFATAPSRARRRLRPGDVLIATVRPNLQAHLHFVDSGDASDWVCSTGFCVLRCRAGVSDPSFIFAQFFGPSIPRQIGALIAGSNYPAISSADVRNLTVSAPNLLEEQTAIAHVLSDMDAEIAALEVRLDKARALKQAMMQALLTGRVRLPIPPQAAQAAKETANV